MQATTSGEFRVLEAPRGASGHLTLLDRSDLEPTLVDASDYEDDLARVVTGLRPGYLVEAVLEWTDGTARFAEVEVTSYTLFEYAQGVSGLFEAALETMAEARQEGVGVMGRPTFSTDGEPNGAVYAIAEQHGERDVFEDIQTGRLPLEPLIDRLEDASGEEESTTTPSRTAAAEDDHEVFVMRPVEHDFVLVYLVARRNSLLAETVRETYECPRPTEPLRD